MSAKVIVISSSLPGAGKTHFAAGLACWLKERGNHAAPVHISAPAGDPVPCPEGGAISRAAALLAEASGLMPEPIYESGWQAILALAPRFDTVFVEAPTGAPIPGVWPTLRLSRNSGRIFPEGFASLAEFQHDLMPGYDSAIAGLPLWSLASGPRCGVVTLPHIANFRDYQLLRGSEWLTVPAVGRFSHLFLPATTNTSHDLDWLQETGLSAWIAAQCATGAKLSVCGWDYPNADRCEPGDLLDFRFLSARIGRRVPPLMPDEATLHQLATWFGEWASLKEFTRARL